MKEKDSKKIDQTSEFLHQAEMTAHFQTPVLLKAVELIKEHQIRIVESDTRLDFVIPVSLADLDDAAIIQPTLPPDSSLSLLIGTKILPTSAIPCLVCELVFQNNGKESTLATYDFLNDAEIIPIASLISKKVGHDNLNIWMEFMNTYCHAFVFSKLQGDSGLPNLEDFLHPN